MPSVRDRASAASSGWALAWDWLPTGPRRDPDVGCRVFDYPVDAKRTLGIPVKEQA